jgi:hypothetical protein
MGRDLSEEAYDIGLGATNGRERQRSQLRVKVEEGIRREAGAIAGQFKKRVFANIAKDGCGV